MKQSTIYLILTWVTVVIGLAATYPIFIEHGNTFDIPRFISDINLNASMRFIGIDLSLILLSFIPFMYFESKKIGLKYWALPLVGMALVGACLVVPWFFYRRAKHIESK